MTGFAIWPPSKLAGGKHLLFEQKESFSFVTVNARTHARTYSRLHRRRQLSPRRGLRSHRKEEQQGLDSPQMVARFPGAAVESKRVLEKRAVPAQTQACTLACVHTCMHGQHLAATHSRTARHGPAWHGTARHGTAQHGTAWHGTARHGPARPGPARPSPA